MQFSAHRRTVIIVEPKVGGRKKYYDQTRGIIREANATIRSPHRTAIAKTSSACCGRIRRLTECVLDSSQWIMGK